MKSLKFYLPLSLLILILISCSSKEKILDTVGDNWPILVSSNINDPILTKLNQPDGILLINDVFSLNNNGEKLSGPVQKIAEDNSGNLYLFIPLKFKIEVISNQDFKRVATLDFSSTGRIPTGICFYNEPNYCITFGNDSTVDILDASVFKIARTIKVGKYPVSIASAGNQIFVTNFGDNTVSIIDSRFYTIKTVPVSPCPYYVDVGSGNTVQTTAAVVSIGTGKADSTNVKSQAMLTIFDVQTGTIIATHIIGISNSDAVNQIPMGLTVNGNNLGFIPTRTNLFRFNIKNGSLSTLQPKGDYRSTLYNYKRDELIIQRAKGNGIETYTADPVSAALKTDLNINTNALAILPLTK